MPSVLHGYRVFIASPGGLEEERAAFREAVNAYNELDAIERGVIFLPVGWEFTPGGVGRPQQLINEDVQRSDFFVLVLWDRWGSPPAVGGDPAGYTSGSEEEFSLAWRCYEEGTMRNIVVFFKTVGPEKMADPGPQLRPVLDFRKRLEAEKRLLHISFDGVPTFREKLQRQLALWVRHHERGSGNGARAPDRPALQLPDSVAKDSPAVEGADRLLQQGRVVEAGTVLARAVVADDLEATQGYASLLLEAGNRTAAEETFMRLRSAAQRRGSLEWEIKALTGLAEVYEALRRLDDQEACHREILRLREASLGPSHPDVAASLDGLARSCVRHGRPREAVPLLQRALAILNGSGAPMRDVATIQHHLGEAYREAGDYRRAGEALRLALAQREEALGPDDPKVAESLRELADLYRTQGLYIQAAPILRRALQIAEERLGAGDPATGRVLLTLAELDGTLGRYDEAEDSLQRALQIAEGTFGRDSPETARVVNALANHAVSLARYAVADQLFEHALDIRSTLGPEHLDVATTLNDLAWLDMLMARYGEAERRTLKALRIREHALGDAHPAVAESLHELADLYDTLGKYDDALALFERAVAIKEMALGPAHQSVASSLAGMANVHYEADDFAGARQLYERALGIYEAAVGPIHRNVGMVLSNLSYVHFRQEDYDAAERVGRKALETLESALGPGHRDVAAGLINIGNVELGRERLDGAEEHFRRALALEEAAVGHDHPDYAEILLLLARVANLKGANEKAERLLREALAIRERVTGEWHPQRARSMNELANVVWSLGQLDEAERLYRSAIEIRERGGGRGNLSLSTTIGNLAALLLQRDRPAEAAELFERCIAINTEVFGPGDRRVAELERQRDEALARV